MHIGGKWFLCFSSCVYFRNSCSAPIRLISTRTLPHPCSPLLPPTKHDGTFWKSTLRFVTYTVRYGLPLHCICKAVIRPHMEILKSGLMQYCSIENCCVASRPISIIFWHAQTCANIPCLSQNKDVFLCVEQDRHVPFKANLIFTRVEHIVIQQQDRIKAA